MWNRVVLLASGFALGWTLVHYWTAAPDRLRVQVTRLILSLVVGLGLIIVLWAMAPDAGVAGSLVFALSTLVAYAANAKQVGRVVEPGFIPRPEVPLDKGGRTAVILAAEVEPLRYDGPAPWARLFRAQEAVGGSIPHWFVRPCAYARIRSAYARMGGQHPLAARLAEAAQRLEARLGPPYAVRAVSLLAPGALPPLLKGLVEEGCEAVICLPIGSEAGLESVLREQVAFSRVREIGIPVSYAAPIEAAVWGAGAPAERLRTLMAGQPLPPLMELAADIVEILRQRLAIAVP